MKIAIVYESPTGNTKQLVSTIEKTCSKEEIVYVGSPDEKALSASLIFVGFWTDKGTCDEKIKEFLKMLKNKKVFLFGTAGFGGEATYFKKILETVSKNIEESNQLVGTYMCQGRMVDTVLNRYKKMLIETTNPKPIENMITNFNMAKAHPNQLDFENLKKAVTACLDTISI